MILNYWFKPDDKNQWSTVIALSCHMIFRAATNCKVQFHKNYDYKEIICSCHSENSAAFLTWAELHMHCNLLRGKSKTRTCDFWLLILFYNLSVTCTNQSFPPTLSHPYHFLLNVFDFFRTQFSECKALIPYIFAKLLLFLPSLTTEELQQGMPETDTYPKRSGMVSRKMTV